jgi:hypothetical protein
MKRFDAANDNDAGKQIARTRQIWQPRLGRDLTDDEPTRSCTTLPVSSVCRMRPAQRDRHPSGARPLGNDREDIGSLRPASIKAAFPMNPKQTQ